MALRCQGRVDGHRDTPVGYLTGGSRLMRSCVFLTREAAGRPSLRVSAIGGVNSAAVGGVVSPRARAGCMHTRAGRHWRCSHAACARRAGRLVLACRYDVPRAARGDHDEFTLLMSTHRVSDALLCCRLLALSLGSPSRAHAHAHTYETRRRQWSGVVVVRLYLALWTRHGTALAYHLRNRVCGWRGRVRCYV